MLRGALERITALLPSSWTLTEQRADLAAGDAGLDTMAELTGPGGPAVRFAVQVGPARSVSQRSLFLALRELRRSVDLPVLYVSDYIGPSLRDALRREGMSYADTTGWVRISNDDPLVLLTGQGSTRAPKDRTSSAVTRLNGIAANRSIRALATTELPVGVRALAALAQVSPGSASKLLTTLAAEGILERDNTGKVVRVHRRDLIRRWVRDYAFAKSNPATGHYIAPRGLTRTRRRLTGLSGVALTGSAAARDFLPRDVTPVVPMTLLAVYAPHVEVLAASLRLVPADPATANVIIAVPQDATILPSEGVVLAPAPLVVADLLTLPGRADAEAEQLMDSLQATTTGWERRQ